MVFLAVMLLLASTLVVLGWRLIVDDRKLSEKRIDDQREVTAGEAVITLERRIAGIERDLDQALSSGGIAESLAPPAGAVFLEMRQGTIRALPENGLAYYPDPPDSSPMLHSVFSRADELESQGDYAGAIATFQEFTGSSDAHTRAGAWAGIAGIQKKAGRSQEALEAYSRLAELGRTSVDGLPAALAGRLGALKVLETLKDNARLAAAATELDREARSGQWLLSRAGYESLLDETQKFLPETHSKTESREGLAEAARWLWERWRGERLDLKSDRINHITSSGPVLLIWRTSGGSVAAFAASASFVESVWLNELTADIKQRNARLVLLDGEGRAVFGEVIPGARATRRFAGETGLPWTAQIFSIGKPDSRHWVLASGMGVLLVLILMGAWFVGHALNRELAAARLQSDFVSVVSHEFRTPLTALCQLSELLKRGRMTTEADRVQCYDFLYNESHRLRRLVESLLDFGRLESGKMQFRFEPLDAAALLRQSAEEFMEGRHEHPHHLEVAASEAPHIVSADRETLRCVFWNLFENAMKYSPGCDTVWVELSTNGKQVVIAVRDRGVGLPKSEQQGLFEKFVRGSVAQASSIRGAGIGLAMARQIVRAHGGDITLESEPAQGSTFRILLPLVAMT
jgi:signal transduction histidine kinase